MLIWGVALGSLLNYGVCFIVSSLLVGGYKKIIIEMDSRVIIDLILGEFMLNHPFFGLLQSCNDPMAFHWEVKVTHIFREANHVADALVNMGHALAWVFTFSTDCLRECVIC